MKAAEKKISLSGYWLQCTDYSDIIDEACQRKLPGDHSGVGKPSVGMIFRERLQQYMQSGMPDIVIGKSPGC